MDYVLLLLVTILGYILILSKFFKSLRDYDLHRVLYTYSLVIFFNILVIRFLILYINCRKLTEDYVDIYQRKKESLH